jgi:hypothetical protein
LGDGARQRIAEEHGMKRIVVIALLVGALAATTGGPVLAGS